MRQDLNFIVTAYAQAVIGFKSRELSQRPEFRRESLDDIQQTLWTALAARAKRFDASRASLNTFIDRAVNSGAANMIRDNRRKKRWACVQSLDQAIGEAEPLSVLISPEHADRRIGRNADDPIDQAESDEALEFGLSIMPAELRQLCREIMGGSVTESARKHVKSRRCVKKQLLAAIPFLEQSGITFSDTARSAPGNGVSNVRGCRTPDASDEPCHSLHVRSQRRAARRRIVAAPGDVRRRGARRPGAGAHQLELPDR
jgi:RNA polymerase sigma factor (sigma-70 family)